VPPPSGASAFTSSASDNLGNAFTFNTIVSNGKGIAVSNNPSGPTYFQPSLGPLTVLFTFNCDSYDGSVVTLSNVTTSTIVVLYGFGLTVPFSNSQSVLFDGISQYAFTLDNSFCSGISSSVTFS
jgi:hypothetical protein